MKSSELASTAQSLVARGKGILAADESFSTIRKRFESISVESTEETRCSYRELLFTTERIEEFISGVILFDETIRQTGQDGMPLTEVLVGKGIVPGIKVDNGAKELAGFPGEKITEGLDGLGDRLSEYRGLGARFAKWRAVITIGDGIPSMTCIESNAHALARYAALCQEAGLVPVVEPEVLMDGDHDIQRCEQVTCTALDRVFSHLREQRVLLEGILLKPNMIIPGKDCPTQADSAEIARATIRCFRDVVPPAVPGIVFLSGGQSPVQATENLHAMNAREAHPWVLSFSYGRALQEPALRVWKGQAANVSAAQTVFLHRAKCNGAARMGIYSTKMEPVI